MNTSTSTCRMVFLALAGFIFSCSRGAIEPSWVGELGYEPTEVFPIQVRAYGYPFVEVNLDGSPHWLAFDTGNMTGLLLAPELVTELGLETVGSNTHYDASGAVVGTANVYLVPELEAFGSVWHEQSAHEHTLEGVRGLIGPKYLSGRRFTLDYRNRLMAVSDSSGSIEIADDVVLPMIRSPRHDALILVEGNVNGRQTTIEIDTGKSRTVVDSELVQSFGLVEAPNGYRIDDIRLGSFQFSAPSAKEKSFKGISRGLDVPIGLGVGSDTLSQMVMTVDYRTRQVFLRDH